MLKLGGCRCGLPGVWKNPPVLSFQELLLNEVLLVQGLR